MNLKQKIINTTGREKIKLIREFKALSPREKIKILKEYARDNFVDPKVIEALEKIKEVLENQNSTQSELEAIRPDVELVEENEESVMGSDLLLEVFDLMDIDAKLEGLVWF